MIFRINTCQSLKVGSNQTFLSCQRASMGRVWSKLRTKVRLISNQSLEAWRMLYRQSKLSCKPSKVLIPIVNYLNRAVLSSTNEWMQRYHQNYRTPILIEMQVFPQQVRGVERAKIKLVYAATALLPTAKTDELHKQTALKVTLIWQCKQIIRIIGLTGITVALLGTQIQVTVLQISLSPHLSNEDLFRTHL